jgi:hypothetical protein
MSKSQEKAKQIEVTEHIHEEQENRYKDQQNDGDDYDFANDQEQEHDDFDFGEFTPIITSPGTYRVKITDFRVKNSKFIWELERTTDKATAEMKLPIECVDKEHKLHFRIQQVQNATKLSKGKLMIGKEIMATFKENEGFLNVFTVFEAPATQKA